MRMALCLGGTKRNNGKLVRQIAHGWMASATSWSWPKVHAALIPRRNRDERRALSVAQFPHRRSTRSSRGAQRRCCQWLSAYGSPRNKLYFLYSHGFAFLRQPFEKMVVIPNRQRERTNDGSQGTTWAWPHPGRVLMPRKILQPLLPSSQRRGNGTHKLIHVTRRR